MTYDTSGQPVECGSCGQHVPPGMPIYRVTVRNLPRCSTCASRYGVELQAFTGASVAAAPEPLDFSRFRRKEIAADVRQRILDQRRAGSA